MIPEPAGAGMYTIDFRCLQYRTQLGTVKASDAEDQIKRDTLPFDEVRYTKLSA
jgi:hypothetical protein